MYKYKGVIFATVFMVGMSIIFLMIGGIFVFVAGVSIGTAGMLLSFYWLETILGSGNYDNQKLKEYRKINLPVLVEGLGLGILNYLILTMLFKEVTDFTAAIAIILPMFVSAYTIRILFLCVPEEERLKTLTPAREFLLSLFADLGLLGIIIGLKILLQ